MLEKLAVFKGVVNFRYRNDYLAFVRGFHNPKAIYPSFFLNGFA